MFKITILDAGGQYCNLIARRIRELGVYSEIVPFSAPVETLKGASGIVISGGPHSVYDHSSPKVDPLVFDLKIPILGICYGHQLIAGTLGGSVEEAKAGEYGITELEIKTVNSIFKGINKSKEVVWMSHKDTVVKIPDRFQILGSTKHCYNAAIGDLENKIYGVQFHPEVVHTSCGYEILHNFVFNICRCIADWKPKDRIDTLTQEIKKNAKGKNIFFLISGGVDSTVAFKLCVKALGEKRVFGLYIDTGFMRKNETKEIKQSFKDMGISKSVHTLDASDDFYQSLAESYDPEEKRKIIGNKFLEIQQKSFDGLKFSGGKWILGQGTIYPDTIESAGTAQASLIKTHHNRVEIIHDLIKKGKIIEPLKEFYKDEIRELAKALKLPDKIATRLPFPGPGLAIRCLCSPDEYDVECNNNINRIIKELNLKLESGLISIRTVGVQGDHRTYSNLVILSGDVDYGLLENISNSVTNQASNVNRVAYLVLPIDVKLSEFRIKKAFITKERIELLREADYIVAKFMQGTKVSSKIWQFPVVLLPLSIKGGESIALRPVSSKDGMTADYTKIPPHLLHELSKEILKLNGVDAVLYDITNKPPATIEWE